MKRYIVRYEEIYSAVVYADSPEDACHRASKADFNHDDTSEFDAEPDDNYEPPDDPIAWSGGFADNH